MFNFKFLYFIIFLLELQQSKSRISDKRYCANKNCTKPISRAKTVLSYLSPDNRILSFSRNADVIVYSKPSDSHMNLWGVEVNGKRGYVPKEFLRETKILSKTVPFLVDTELNDKQILLKKIDNEIKERKGITVNKSDYDDFPTSNHLSIKPITAIITDTHVAITTNNDEKTCETNIKESVKNKEAESSSICNKTVETSNSNKVGVNKSLPDNLYQSVEYSTNGSEKKGEKYIMKENDKNVDDKPVDDEEDDLEDEDDGEYSDEEETEVGTEHRTENTIKVTQLSEINGNEGSEDTIKSTERLSEEGALTSENSVESMEALSDEDTSIFEDSVQFTKLMSDENTSTLGDSRNITNLVSRVTVKSTKLVNDESTPIPQEGVIFTKPLSEENKLMTQDNSKSLCLEDTSDDPSILTATGSDQ